ncbi:unnamed protein product [Sphenostylis stenocarpa]|uniref:Uncharacterized protein n=1 Tax=Sphenostylis stenocarpa TaxID=92480 RepID=A0AA86VVN7_9FABA|nr:unnamed protein product [Sphenostylis stenocarpa]
MDSGKTLLLWNVVMDCGWGELRGGGRSRWWWPRVPTYLAPPCGLRGYRCA